MFDMMRMVGWPKKVFTLGLIAILMAGLIIPTQQVLAESTSSPLQTTSARDKKAVAIDTIRHVIEGLKKVREFLSTQNIPPEVLRAIDTAITNLETTIQIVQQIGDVQAADAALKSTSKRSEDAAKVAGKKDKSEEKRIVQEAIRRALERADELSKEVERLGDAKLRAKLAAEIERARTLLNQASSALANDDIDTAAKLLGDAVKILGNVNTEIHKAKGEEKVSKAGQELAERLQGHISELRERIARLREEISKSDLPSPLSKELLDLLTEASKLLDDAEAAIKSGDIQNAVSLVGKANALINRVEAKVEIQLRHIDKINEDIEKVLDEVDEIRNALREKNLPSDIVAQVNQLLDTALALVKQAQEAISRGDFGEANSSVSKARAAVERAKGIVKSGEEGRAESKELRAELEAGIEGTSIRVRIENKGDVAITVTSIKVFDSAGNEIKVNWVKTCMGTLDRHERLECAGTGDFKAGQTYQVVVEVKKADLAEVTKLQVSVTAGAKEEEDVEAKARIEGRSIKVKIENEGDKSITVLSVKVFDSAGREVTVEWKNSCTISLGKGQEVRCEGTGSFQRGSIYKVVIEWKRAEETTTSKIEVTVQAR